MSQSWLPITDDAGQEVEMDQKGTEMELKLEIKHETKEDAGGDKLGPTRKLFERRSGAKEVSKAASVRASPRWSIRDEREK